MNIVIAALLALLVGIIVKFVLGFFDTTKPHADPVAVIVAILAFLHFIGVF